MPIDAKDGCGLIAAERARQISIEGWSLDHDDEYTEGELTAAAVCYVFHAAGRRLWRVSRGVPAAWPWNAGTWQPGDPIRDLVKAGALIAAEIDRLQRQAELTGG